MELPYHRLNNQGVNLLLEGNHHAAMSALKEALGTVRESIAALREPTTASNDDRSHCLTERTEHADINDLIDEEFFIYNHAFLFTDTDHDGDPSETNQVDIADSVDHVGLVTAIIMFNMALVHHTVAVTRRKRVDRAMTLYNYVVHLPMTPDLVRLACANNSLHLELHAHLVTGRPTNTATVEQRLQELRQRMRTMTSANELVEVLMRGFMGNAVLVQIQLNQSSLERENWAPAA